MGLRRKSSEQNVITQASPLTHITASPSVLNLDKNEQNQLNVEATDQNQLNLQKGAPILLNSETTAPNLLNDEATEPNQWKLQQRPPILLNSETTAPNLLNVEEKEPNQLNSQKFAPILLNSETTAPNQLNVEVTEPNPLNLQKDASSLLNSDTSAPNLLNMVTMTPNQSIKQPTYSGNPENFISPAFQENVRLHYSEFFIPTDSLFFYERIYYSKTRYFSPVLYSEEKVVQCACGVLNCKLKRKNCKSSCGFCHLPMKLQCIHLGSIHGCCRKCFMEIYDKEKSTVTTIPAPESSVFIPYIKFNLI